MNWLITDKGDQDARRLADDHYSRQTPGARQFTRNGQNLVFITEDLKAVWVTFRPTPGVAVRQDGLDCWECALFRNTGNVLSSKLIIEAVYLSVALWGQTPVDGVITYVKPSAVRSINPGCCFKKAGWVRNGSASDGKPRYKAPIVELKDYHHWTFRDDRGGKLRRDLRRRDLIAEFLA